ncbi:MAG: helix-turn-helix domain-containing protein [Phycisphaerae bacterium]
MKEIAAELKSEGKTQAEIAASLGVARETIRNWMDDVRNGREAKANHDCRVVVPKSEWGRVSRARAYRRVALFT